MERITVVPERKGRRLEAAALSLALVAALIAPASAAVQTDNIEVVGTFPFGLGNEIEFKGNHVLVGQYQGQDHAIQVFKHEGDSVRQIGRIPCSYHNDVAALKNGLLAVSFQGRGISCVDPGPLDLAGFGPQGGVQAIVAKNMSRPTYKGVVELPGGVHTITAYPDSNYVYAALGGADVYTVHGGNTNIIDFSNPGKPKIAAVYHSTLNPAGCHDVAFAEIKGKTIGFCPGLGGTEIWDASDPEAPVALGRMVLPVGQLPHQVAISSDGKLAAISDEAYAGHACAGGGPAGALWFWDISDLTDPQVLGFYGPQRGDAPVGALSGQEISCTAHNFNFVPNTRLLVAAWIGGGTNVLDLTDPAAAKEIAVYQPGDTAAMSAYWYRGLIFVADFQRGLDVIRLRK